MGGVAALLLAEVAAVAPYIERTGSALLHPRIVWLATAIAVELVSVSSFAQMQHRMVHAAGGHVSLRKIMAMTYSANALCMTLPGGAAVSSGYTFRRLRGWGVSVPSASFALISSGVLSTSSFALITLAAALAFGATHSSPLLLVTTVLIVAGLLAGLRWLTRRPELTVRVGRRVLSTADRLRRLPVGDGDGRVRRFLGELTAIKPRSRDWLAGLGLAGWSWGTDLLCLLTCAKAVGLNGATMALLLASYLAGRSVSGFSVLPAGLGIVDAAMVLTLTRGDVPIASAAAIVLLYRLVSVALVVAIGWVVWLNTSRRDNQAATATARTHRPLAATEPRQSRLWHYHVHRQPTPRVKNLKGSEPDGCDRTRIDPLPGSGRLKIVLAPAAVPLAAPTVASGSGRGAHRHRVPLRGRPDAPDRGNLCAQSRPDREYR